MNDATADRKMEPGRAAPSVRVPGWLRRLAATVSANWFLKLIGIPGFIALFFVAYFWTLHSTPFPVTTVPVTLLDHFITFRPEALPLYLSLWVYVSLPQSLLDDRRELFFLRSRRDRARRRRSRHLPFLPHHDRPTGHQLVPPSGICVHERH